MQMTQPNIQGRRLSPEDVRSVAPRSKSTPRNVCTVTCGSVLAHAAGLQPHHHRGTDRPL